MYSFHIFSWIILNHITIKKQNLTLNFKNLYRKWNHTRDFSALFHCCVPVFLFSILYLAKSALKQKAAHLFVLEYNGPLLGPMIWKVRWNKDKTQFPRFRPVKGYHSDKPYRYVRGQRMYLLTPLGLKLSANFQSSRFERGTFLCVLKPGSRFG